MHFKELPKLHRALMLPLARNLGRRFPAYYKDLLRSEAYSKAQLQSMQLRKLKQLVRYSYANVPRITELMESIDLTPDNFTCIDDLRKFPFCSKETLRDLPPRYVSDNSRALGDLFRDSTSGSTGEPFVFYKDENKRDHAEAYKMRNFRWIGSTYGTKYYSIWGFIPRVTRVSKLFHKLVTRRHLFSADASVEVLHTYLNILKKEPGVFLIGYTSAVVLLAKIAREAGARLQLGGIMTGAETLSPSHRSLIESTFNCEVFNRYGTREFGDIAMESTCHHGLHIYDESFIVEVVDQDGKPCREGSLGEIVVTDLDNYAMPFIRYKTGDLAAFPKQLPQKCNLSHSVMSGPVGRMVDYIQVGNKIISFGFLVLTFEDYPQIRQFQLEQVSDTKAVLRIVKGKGYSQEIMSPLFKSVRVYCHPLEVELELVNQIIPEKSGKIRIVKSLKGLTDIERIGQGLESMAS